MSVIMQMRSFNNEYVYDVEFNKEYKGYDHYKKLFEDNWIVEENKIYQKKSTNPYIFNKEEFLDMCYLEGKNHRMPLVVVLPMLINSFRGLEFGPLNPMRNTVLSDIKALDERCVNGIVEYMENEAKEPNVLSWLTYVIIKIGDLNKGLITDITAELEKFEDMLNKMFDFCFKIQEENLMMSASVLSDESFKEEVEEVRIIADVMKEMTKLYIVLLFQNQSNKTIGGEFLDEALAMFSLKKDNSDNVDVKKMLFDFYTDSMVGDNFKKVSVLEKDLKGMLIYSDIKEEHPMLEMLETLLSNVNEEQVNSLKVFKEASEDFEKAKAKYDQDKATYDQDKATYHKKSVEYNAAKEIYEKAKEIYEKAKEIYYVETAEIPDKEERAKEKEIYDAEKEIYEKAKEIYDKVFKSFFSAHNKFEEQHKDIAIKTTELGEAVKIYEIANAEYLKSLNKD